jgi:hypothetical protein
MPGTRKISSFPLPSDTTPCGVTGMFLLHLPQFQTHARFAFRRVACPQTRDDRVAEALALAWKHFVTLSARGRRPEMFVTTLALRCTQAVKAGRKLVGNEGGRDVMSPVARVRHGFAVGRLPEAEANKDLSSLPADLSQALVDNTRSAVPEQVAFRVDFPRWRASLRERDRAVLDALAGGERGQEVARRFNISPGRVSQLRREFREGWEVFHRERQPGLVGGEGR